VFRDDCQDVANLQGRRGNVVFCEDILDRSALKPHKQARKLRMEILSQPSINRAFHQTQLSRTFKANHCIHKQSFLGQVFSKLDEKCEKLEQNLFYVPEEGTAFTEQNFLRLANTSYVLAWQPNRSASGQRRAEL
jgi:hypothetical protein